MKQAVKLAKAKVQRELSFQRKLKEELSRYTLLNTMSTY